MMRTVSRFVVQVWARDYSAEDPERCDCDALQEALSMIQGARRMVCSPELLLLLSCSPAVLLMHAAITEVIGFLHCSALLVLFRFSSTAV